MNNFLYSLFNFVTALLFLIIGVVCIALPWSPEIRTELVQFILEDTYLLLILGSVFLLLSFMILFHLWVNLKRRYYRLRSHNRSVIVDEAVFQQYLDTYWKQLFPENDVPSNVIVGPKKLKITADLPYVPLSEQKDLLKRIQSDLEELFGNFVGYQRDYVISISFQSEHSPNG